MCAAISFPSALTEPAEIAVVVVTYHPGGDLESRLQQMRAQGGALVVIDNGSTTAEVMRLDSACRTIGADLILNVANVGLGAALNQGVDVMRGRGFQWVLLFDQDSLPAPNLSRKMIESLRQHPVSSSVAIVGANIQERSSGLAHRVLCENPSMHWLPKKVAAGANDLLRVSMVMTSGSLIRAAAFDVLGRFDESFFIDYVDTDFCLRCRRQGAVIAVSAAARLEHSLGQRVVSRWLGFKIHPTNHSPLRHFYIARNRVFMWRRFACRFPHWALFDLATIGLWLFRVLTVEANKMRKLQAMALGTWDGLRGSSGPCPAKRLELLTQ